MHDWISRPQYPEIAKNTFERCEGRLMFMIGVVLKKRCVLILNKTIVLIRFVKLICNLPFLVGKDLYIFVIKSIQSPVFTI